MLSKHRLIALITLAAIGLLYWHPVSRYLEASRTLAAANNDVHRLRRQNAKLAHAIERVGSGETLIAEARQLGLIRPGERLFIVQGIDAWRRAQHH